jgi:hypothetical protein
MTSGMIAPASGAAGDDDRELPPQARVAAAHVRDEEVRDTKVRTTDDDRGQPTST